MRNLIIVFILLVPFVAKSQVIIDVDSDRTPHSQWEVNPANSTQEKVFVLLPVLGGYQFGLGHTGFAFSDAINNNQVSFGTTVDALDKENHLLIDGSINLFSLGFHVKNTQFRLGAIQQFESRSTYTRDFLEMLWLGNGHPDVIGNRVSLDNTGINALAITKVFVGTSLELLPEKLTLGANLNFYSGLGTIQTFESKFGLTTSDTDYALKADGELAISAAGVIDLSDFENGLNFRDISSADTGLGADLGVIFKPSPKHEVKASVLNLGQINWTNNMIGYELSDSEIEFSGFDLQSFTDSNDTLDVVQHFIDSITNVFTPEEVEASFNTKLNPEVTFSFSFIPSDKNKYTFLYRSKDSFGITLNHAGILYSRSFGKILEISGGAVLFNRKDLIVPFSLVLDAGPVQLGLQTTNVLVPFRAKKTKFASVSVSLALVLGEKEK